MEIGASGCHSVVIGCCSACAGVSGCHKACARISGCHSGVIGCCSACAVRCNKACARRVCEYITNVSRATKPVFVMSQSRKSRASLPAPKRQRTNDDASWPRAAVFSQGEVSIELFTVDGSAFADRRSFVVGQVRDGRKYTLRLRFKELIWLNALLFLEWGTHTLTLFPGRVLTLRISDTLTSLSVSQERSELKIYFDPSRTQTLIKLIKDLLRVFEFDWGSVPTDDLLQAFGQLRRRNAVDSPDLLKRALGTRIYGKPVDSLIDYGEGMGNPPAALVTLADRLLPLVQCLVCDDSD